MTWGKLISIKDENGNDITNDINSVGYKNPYRYRGYRYDTETGLYYLNSRYYNPEWGRFINADGIVGQTGELLSHNMFAYCKNNPVNMHDPDGYFGIRKLKDKLFYAYLYFSVYMNLKFQQFNRGVLNGISRIASRVLKKNSETLMDAESKADALKSVKSLPLEIQKSVKSFFKGSSTKFSEYTVETKGNNYLVKMTKPGNVPGSKAIYYKEIGSDGLTIKVYKDTFDPLGDLVHRKNK